MNEPSTGMNYISFFTGGVAGSILTIFYKRFVNRLQKMQCHLIDSQIISRIPGVIDEVEHKNLHSKVYHLINTTNIDIKTFRIIFEFDVSANIMKFDTFCKAGSNKYKSKRQKPNEIMFGLKNFNRKDVVKFYFDIANVTNNEFNITETECLGFRIITKDKRKQTKPIRSTIVTKEKLNER